MPEVGGPRPAWPVRLANGLGRLAGGRWPVLDPTRMWDRAREAAGDGPSVPEAREALGVLLDQANRAPLTLVGRLSFANTLPTALEQLLRVAAAVPDPAPPVLPPVVVAALPRTGTTLLHRLLSLHSGARWPRLWELLRPHPAPTPDDDHGRIALAEQMARQAAWALPGFERIHALDPVGPDECWFLQAQTACSVGYDAQLPAPEYTRWVLAQDPAWTYVHHRRALALLQRHVSGAFWLLKTPLHLFGLDALRETYPDARLVVTHREPREVAGSCCSLYEHVRVPNVRPFDPATLGPAWLEVWGEGTDRAAAALARWPAERVVHVAYPALVRDPVGVVEDIVARLGLPDDPGLAARVAAWIRDPAHRQHRHGEHRYTLERYGLRAEAVDERFAPWRRVAEAAAG